MHIIVFHICARHRVYVLSPLVSMRNGELIQKRLLSTSSPDSVTIQTTDVVCSGSPMAGDITGLLNPPYYPTTYLASYQLGTAIFYLVRLVKRHLNKTVTKPGYVDPIRSNNTFAFHQAGRLSIEYYLTLMTRVLRSGTEQDRDLIDNAIMARL